ncbi:MAG: DNA primase small subunit domain-containing protein, partial [Candidatus Saccharimonadales bacterium]
YLANQAALTLHIWLSRRQHIHRPDRMVFDLDPSEDNFDKVKQAARIMKDVLEARGYESELMTTGSRGLHVIVPIEPKRNFETVHKETRKLAEEAKAAHPELLTTEAHIAKRGKNVYLDVARNSYGQTQVAPYSLRARPGAPAATPIGWQELDGLKSARHYGLANIGARLK